MYTKGHYMPTLAKKIVDTNNFIRASGLNKTILPFVGFAVGNPYTNPYSGGGAMLETFWNRQLVAEPTWNLFLSQVQL